MTPYLQKGTAVLNELGVNPEHGLSDGQVAQSLETYGRNVLQPAKKESLMKRILHALSEKMVLILIFAALIALGVNLAKQFTGGETDFIEVIGIFVAIALSVGISVGMEGRSAKAFEALAKLSEDTLVKVIRDGRPVMLAQKEIVVGDIICVETGDKTAADGRLVESVALRADESALTGESEAVKKDADAVIENENTPVAERHNMLYSGCFITAGSGKMVVTAVGGGTEFGKIAQELSKNEGGTTPLNEKLGKLGKIIALLGASAAVLVFLVQLILIALNSELSFNLQTVSDAFINSIILIVAVVPEGLPTILAVSLSINIIKMSRQNALVKKLVASETIGCVNVICSDKTGTLTENKMTVTDVYLNGKVIAPDKLPASPMLQNFCINSTADIESESNGRLKFLGNPTECALLAAVQKSGADYKEVRKPVEIAHVYSFSSDTKNMTTVVRADNGYVVYTKGSPEKIISMCQMPDSEKVAVEKEITAFQQKAARVLAFAHKTVSELSDFEDQASVESGLTFDGFVVISDPLRADVYDAVKECRRARIELMMLTGDNIVTATAIANKLHLLEGGYIAVEAHELEDLSDEEFNARLKNIRVIARSTPIVKMRVVKALKAQGNVVAVTGDGINDAPALKSADVGIAMGITGTEVSKEASDIVLLDDSFSTIATSVKWGRGMYENFQRFLQFQLTVNLSSVIVVLMSLLLGSPMPFTALQLLWINLIMDGPPALTLGLEPMRGDLMAHAPTKRNASIVSKHMLLKIIVNGLFISAVFLAQQQFNFLGIESEQIPTVLFAIFALFQLFNAFNAREIGKGSIFPHIHKNKLMLAAMGVTFVLQVVMTQFGTAFFGTVPLGFITWLKVFAVSASIIVLSEIAKLIYKLIDRIRGGRQIKR